MSNVLGYSTSNMVVVFHTLDKIIAIDGFSDSSDILLTNILSVLIFWNVNNT